MKSWNATTADRGTDSATVGNAPVSSMKLVSDETGYVLCTFKLTLYLLMTDVKYVAPIVEGILILIVPPVGIGF